MGRGCGWTDVELAHLARAWVYATEDPIVGIDQTAGRFRATMFQKFKDMAPDDAHEKTYGGRTPKSVRAKVDEVAADVQKFRNSMKRVKSCNPTGVNISEILSMSIAVHLGKRDTMSYEARNFPHTQWRNHLAYGVLKSHPKFSDESVCSSVNASPTPSGQVPSQTQEIMSAVAAHTNAINDQESPIEEINPDISNNAEESDNITGSEKEERPRGRKSSIRIKATDRHREKAIESSRKIALSLERRNELAEERSALLAYRKEDCETQEDLEDRAEYLRLIRKERLRALRQRISGCERGTPRPRLDSDSSRPTLQGTDGSTQRSDDSEDENNDIEVDENRNSQGDGIQPSEE